MKKIGIINVGSGNFRSLYNALNYLKVNTIISNNFKDLNSCDKLIIPGVGAFKHVMAEYKKLKLDSAIMDWGSTKPILGICLGMQILFESSEENGIETGLNIFKGNVLYLKNLNRNYSRDIRLPHVGWKKLNIKRDNFILLKDIDNSEKFYFTHSYGVSKDTQFTNTTTVYESIEFTSMISKNNIFGVQFHPEKSGYHGLKLLKNFTEI